MLSRLEVGEVCRVNNSVGSSSERVLGFTELVWCWLIVPLRALLEF